MTDALAVALPRLAAWYAQNKKDFPWRQSPTPYHVWLSEIMLQQTRIEAALPYYTRFLEALSDIPSLAGADDELLLKLWQGLGYYSRVRNLKKAALQVMQEYGGKLPKDADKLRKLSGIGDYTAGAIASIAYGLPEPAVDGNVLRVVMRYANCDDDVMKPATRKAVTEALRAVYPSGKDAGLVTEGLMELGETVCIPNGEPLCQLCPLADICKGHAAGTAGSLPTRTKPQKRRIEKRTVLVLACDGTYALSKRPDKGLLASLWELPSVDGHATLADMQARFPHAVSITPLTHAIHVFSHVEWHMTGYRVELSLPLDGYVWETADVIRARYAIPTAFRTYSKTLT